MKQLGRFDWLLMLAICGLLFFSLLIIRSIAPDLFRFQLVYSIFGLIIFMVLSFVDWRIFLKFSWFLYLFSIGLLILTLILGSITRGAVRWLEFGGFRLQPAEVVKPFLIIFFAWFYDFFGIEKKNIFFSLLALGLPLILIIMQPDLGSGLIIIGVWLGILVASGAKLRYFLGGGTLFTICLPVIWQILHDYQKDRILIFLDPFSDPLKSGYNVIQSITAIGSGQFFGWGLGRGPQSHLRFLPENHTDFIFASLTEELGFLGGIMVLFLLGIICWRVLTIARKSDSRIGFLIGIGVFSLIFCQFFINISMNVGILPVTGITLPLVSYGGSSLISILICLGLVESMARFIKKNEVKYRL